MFGLAHTVASVLLNVLGSLLSERFFKEATSVSLYAKVAHIKAGELMVTVAMMFLIPSAAHPVAGHSGMLAGFDWRAWRVVGFLVLDSWMSIIVVKQLSSVIKALAKCVSLVLLFILSVAVFKTKSFQLMQFITAMPATWGVSRERTMEVRAQRTGIQQGGPLRSRPLRGCGRGRARGRAHARGHGHGRARARARARGRAHADVDSFHRRRCATAERPVRTLIHDENVPALIYGENALSGGFRRSFVHANSDLAGI